MKKIGILGSGAVATTLGNGFLKLGHEVMLGTRDANKLAAWQTQGGGNAHIGTFAETAQFGEIILIALKGNIALEALQAAGKENFHNKTVIDATNPIADAPPTNGVLSFFTNLNHSFMEDLQAAIPEAHFVKAFNSVGSAFMVNPSFESKPSMFICGNNENAKKEVSAILDKFGWETEDMGMVESARAIEPLCMLWCIPGFMHNKWTHAFKLLKL